MITVNYTDGITPELKKLVSAYANKRLMDILGKQGEKVLRDHFASKDKTPNKNNWHRTHFWGRLRIVTAYQPSLTTKDTATVVIADNAIKGPIYGPLVRPTPPRRLLAIPMRDEASGRWPSFPEIQRKGLEFVKTKTGNMFLVLSGKRETQFWYRLVPHAQLKKDPTALPTPTAVGLSMLRGVKLWARVNFGKTYRAI